MHVRKRDDTLTTPVRHFDTSASVWVLPKAGASCCSVSHWPDSAVLGDTWKEGQAEAS